MLPAPGNAPAAAAGRPGAGGAGGRGDAWGEPGLGMAEGWLLPTPARGTSLVPMSHPSMRPPRVPSPPGDHATPLPHCFGSFITWGTEEVPLGAPLAWTQPPVSPLPVPTCAATSPGAKRRRVPIPKVPHPQDRAGQTLVPLQTARCLSAPALLQQWGQEQWGGFRVPWSGASPSVGAQQLWAGGRWCGEAVTLPVSALAQSTAAPLNQAS